LEAFKNIPVEIRKGWKLRLVGRLLNHLLHDKLKKILLGHLSRENNYAELAYETVKMEIDVGDCPYGSSDFSISVAGRDSMSEIIYV
ncbi:MAG: hypothetical protein E7F15_15310, partial [Clostridiales bacterium]|nr:hypothetical protein [Clostridiales bacterium]